MMYKSSEIDIATIEVLDGNIFYVQIKKGAEIKLEDAKRLIRATNNMLDDNIPLRGGIYDLSHITYIDEEARDYFADGTNIQHRVVGVALISLTDLGKVIGNLFLNLTDHFQYPIRFCDSPIRAEHWVRSKMREAIDDLERNSKNVA